MITEKQTRQELIDKRLALAGWNVRNPSQVTKELDIDLSATGREKVSESVSPTVSPTMLCSGTKTQFTGRLVA